MNELKVSLQQKIIALAACGWSQRRIARELRLDRSTVKRYAPSAEAKPTTADNPTTGSDTAKPTTTDNPTAGSEAPKPTTTDNPTVGSSGPPGPPSLCEPHRDVIERALGAGLSAQRIHQDLCTEHAFAGSYESVKRFVRALAPALALPFRRMESAPGEQMQVDFGQGAPVVEQSGKRRRAQQHGYEIEEFALGRGGISARRLRKILQSRGIKGLLISVQSSRQFSAQFDFVGFAAATFGYGLASPKLHQASTNMTQGILATTATLESRGYRRIGLAISPWIDARADHTYSGAMLYYQQKVTGRNRVPPLMLPANDLSAGEPHFRRWIRKHQPDAVISFHRLVPDWLRLGMRQKIPANVALVIHDWIPAMAEFAGIDHQRAQVAAAAVDLVATQLQHHESGVPEYPRQVLISPRFVEGPSIRAPKLKT